MFIINTIALELLLLSIVYIANGYNWYLCLVMPFVLMVAIYVIICYCQERSMNKQEGVVY